MYTCARHVGCDFIPQNPEDQNKNKNWISFKVYLKG